MSSTNPFEDVSSSRSRASGQQQRGRNSRHRSSQGEPPIWAARHVDWPVPSALSLQNYNRLLKASKASGQQLGIIINVAGVSGGVDGKHPNKPSSLSPHHVTLHLNHPQNAAGTIDDSRSDTGTTTESNYFSGFMSRVLNTSVTSEKSDDEDGSIDAGLASSRPIRPPRSGCVAAANGWIVAALECWGSSSDHRQQVLRLASRWNVRRGGMADQWIALPPPVEGDGRMAHVFVDPTASHTFLSAANGEAYYLHSSSQQKVVKMVGFGRNADGTVLPKESLTGVPATAVAHRRDESSQAAVQVGLSIGTFVTAVAWDKERGTEGSSKRILLGTSGGEIYEYSLVSPNSADQEEASALPILLHKLYTPGTADPTEIGAAVTGLYFERLRTGLLVLAATSGRTKRTRFYTFYSAHNTSFRMVMADKQHASLVELPGSVDFADLRLCNDHFGLKTATGIYYGAIDRSLSGSASLSGSSSMIIESGILPYDDGAKGIVDIPVSLALTPNHLVTLGELNNVLFINKVAQKVIQKESVVVSAQGSIDDTSFGVGELLMDIRRPDQVWLRKGRSLVHISSSQEDRDVWKYTLKKCIDMPAKSRTSAATYPRIQDRFGGSAPLTPEEKALEALFEQAKALCTNNAQKAVVSAVRAEHHLLHGRAELAAKYLAQCPPVLKPFADTAVRLALPKLGIEDPQRYDVSFKSRPSVEASNLPLIMYLSDKMRLGRMKDDSMTCTMLGAWLTELILHDREEHASSDPERVQQSSAMLAQFLNANVVDAKTVLKILASHDVGPSECASFAAKSGDIGTAVNAALSVGNKDSVGGGCRCAAFYLFVY
jgi:hypothetical protein